jgi:hypothetical protein
MGNDRQTTEECLRALRKRKTGENRRRKGMGLKPKKVKNDTKQNPARTSKKEHQHYTERKS